MFYHRHNPKHSTACPGCTIQSRKLGHLVPEGKVIPTGKKEETTVYKFKVMINQTDGHPLTTTLEEVNSHIDTDDGFRTADPDEVWQILIDRLSHQGLIEFVSNIERVRG